MMARVGIVDWGIGGLDFYRKFKAAFPGVAVHYWSDAGYTPYGKLGADALRARLSRVMERLAAQGVEHCVIACNAASSVLPVQTSLRCCGVIEATVGGILARHDPCESIAVLGGERTIASRAYQGPLEDAGFDVMGRVAQPLSAWVEAGTLEGPQVEACIKEIVRPVVDAQILVLACTHYVALAPIIARYVQARVLVDPARETLDDVRRRWHFESSVAADVFCTTGDPRAMRAAGLRAFGVALEGVDQVEI